MGESDIRVPCKCQKVFLPAVMPMVVVVPPAACAGWSNGRQCGQREHASQEDSCESFHGLILRSGITPAAVETAQRYGCSGAAIRCFRE